MTSLCLCAAANPAKATDEQALHRDVRLIALCGASAQPRARWRERSAMPFIDQVVTDFTARHATIRDNATGVRKKAPFKPPAIAGGLWPASFDQLLSCE